MLEVAEEWGAAFFIPGLAELDAFILKKYTSAAS